MDHGLELIIPDPGNIWKFDFYNFLISWKYWKFDFSNFLISWKYGRRAGGGGGRAAAGGRWRAGHPPAGESSWEGGGRGRPGREARGSLVMCLGVRKKNVMRGQVLGCSPEAPAPRALRCVVTAPRPRARSGVAGTCRQRPPPRCCQTAHRVLLRQAWHRRRLQRPAGGRDRAAEIPAGSG